MPLGKTRPTLAGKGTIRMLCPKFHSVLSLEEGLIAWYCEAHNLQVEWDQPMEIRVEKCVSDCYESCDLYQWLEAHDRESAVQEAA